ncbi:MarR family transcriptional regulator [Amycolatopsis sp. WQ 127309]|uniref:MarR family transcriptional regulator n=1 Tax=Amycolatopsis sp. WQ 127309 TaxID=2932773 RepID=UPI001FF3F6EF|nr:MarR family transcriptional regulator [Amycolatopsis sp. WQ 127309]UOZ03416.1 MarR family transcriptional regulator [Amycolatopsis sp. WQ 127309]
MSRKNNSSLTTNDVLQPLEGPADNLSTEDKVRTALTTHPDSTSAELAKEAGVGRSTAGKILARWDRDGLVVRTAGAGGHKPDTWTLTGPCEHKTDEGTGTASVPTPESASQSDTRPTETATGVVTSEDEEPAPVDSTDSATTAQDIIEEGDEAIAPPSDDAEPAPNGKKRLPKGGLRALVEDYLSENPGESFGPAQIGKVLNRSGGAVSNALDKLEANGYAIRTCPAPKRFSINPAKTDVADPTAAE